MESESATLPVSFFGGKELEPGSRCEVEIVSVEGDSVEVRYVPHESSETEPSFDEQVDSAAAEESGRY